MAENEKPAELKPPHCPECKKPLVLNSAIEPDNMDAPRLMRFLTWCQTCGCLLGCLTMPLQQPGMAAEPSPFAPPKGPLRI